MEKRSLIYIVGVFCILLVVLGMVLSKERNEELQYEINMANNKEETVLGYDIITDYTALKPDIEKGTVIFKIVNDKEKEIPFKDKEELLYVVYAPQKYDKITKTEKNITTITYSLTSLSNLYTTLTRAETYDKEKLELYTDKYKEVVKKARALQSGEVYGKDVLSNFKGHEADINSGKTYFRIIKNGVTTSYTKYDSIKNYVDEQDIFKKGFELNTNGTLKGYTFTFVE